MARVKCFWIEVTGESMVTAVSESAEACKETGNGHRAATCERTGSDREFDSLNFPAACDCGYEFTGDDLPYRHAAWVPLFREPLAGREGVLADFGAGAMFDAPWQPQSCRGDDGRAITVVLPNHLIWCVDAPAAKCARPARSHKCRPHKCRPHKCWARTGNPPKLSIDEDGLCAVSIMAGDYHGKLLNGYLVDVRQ